MEDNTSSANRSNRCIIALVAEHKIDSRDLEYDHGSLTDREVSANHGSKGIGIPPASEANHGGRGRDGRGRDVSHTASRALAFTTVSPARSGVAYTVLKCGDRGQGKRIAAGPRGG